MSTADPAQIRYRDWLSEYWDRREQLFRREVMRVGEEAFQAAVKETEGSLYGPRFDLHARPRQSSLTHRYCLVLWTRHGDLSADDTSTAGQAPDYGDAPMAEILAQRPTSFRTRMAGLTFALDQAGFFALMLYPEGKEGAPPEPLVLPSPSAHIDRKSRKSMKMWEYIFTGFVELAQAVIVDGDVREALAAPPSRKSGLTSELHLMRRAGLLDRLLLLDQNNELCRLDDARRWPIERVGDAQQSCARSAAFDARTVKAETREPGYIRPMNLTNLPPRDDRARTGSSLNGGPVLPAVQLRLRPFQRAWAKLARDRSRQRAKLITAPQRRAAAEQSEYARSAWQRESLLARLEADRRAKAKSDARRQLERSLGRTIPRYRELRQIDRNYLRDAGRVARDLFKIRPRPGAYLNWGPIVWAEPAGKPTTFTAPFPHHVVESFDLHGLLVADNSFALPDAGQLIQNFTFAHNESAWGLQSNANFVDQFASCGVDYTLPSAGLLQVSAEIENLANRLTCAITDNFGWSHSYLTMTADLFIGIVRPGQQMDYFPHRILASHLQSEGDDVSRSFSDLDNAVPFGVGAVSPLPIPAGETVTVLAGAHVRIDSDTDDMDAHVQATFWWRVRKLTVGVI